MRTFFSRLAGRRPSTEARNLSVTVYTRRQCCCCHTALDLVRAYQRRHGFTVVEIDVDSDPDLASRYGSSVPVVEVDGKVRFRGVVNPVLFERILAAEGGNG